MNPNEDKNMDEKEDTNKQVNQQQNTDDPNETIRNWFAQVRRIIATNFPEFKIGGHILLHPQFGHFFAYELRQGEDIYACGFLLTELIDKFEANNNPALWICSFFHEKIQNGQTGGFPKQPETEEDFKRVVEEEVIPLCARNIQGEFPDDPVIVNMEYNEKYGPVLEAGFPLIKEGDNTCMLPLAYIFSLYMLNRDPADPMVYALTKLRDQHQTAQADQQP